MTTLSDCIEQRAIMHTQLSEQDSELVILRATNRLLWDLVENYGEEHDEASHSYRGCECGTCLIRQRLADSLHPRSMHSLSGNGLGN